MHIERERLVHREVILQLDIDPQLRALRRLRDELDDLALDQRAEELPAAPGQRLLRLRRFVAARDERLHRPAAVLGAAEHIEQHAVRDLELAGQPLGRRGDQAREGLLVPVDEVPLRRLALDEFLAAAGLLLLEQQILDDMLRRLRHHPAAFIEALAPRAPADLVEIARAQDACLFPVELAKLREEHGANGDIDADAQRVGAADDLEQAALRELLDEHAILRQQPGVMQPDAVPQPLANLRPVRAAELEAFQRVRDRRFFLARADIDAREILRALGRFQLREMHDIDRAPCRRRQDSPASGQAASPSKRTPAAPAAPGKRWSRSRRPFSRVSSSSKKAVSPERGGHEEKARLRQGQQRHLPGHAALAVRVVVELVHDDVAHVRAWRLRAGRYSRGSPRCSRGSARRDSPRRRPC